MALAQDSVRHDRILDGVAEPCLAVDAGWRIVYVNPAAAEALGAAPEDLIGVSMLDFAGRAPNPAFLAACEDVLAGGPRRRVEQAWADRWFVATISPAADGLVITYTDVTEARAAERRAAWLAAREAALRRISEDVARSASPTDVLSSVAQEAATLVGAHASSVLRFEDGDDRRTTVLGIWRDGGDAPFAVEDDLRLSHNSVILEVRRRGTVVVEEDVEPKAWTAWGSMGCRAHVVAPVHALGRLWGSISLGWLARDAHPGAAEELVEFTQLASLAVDSAAARESLANRATLDPLTGLLNHRAFHERLGEEERRARRYGRPLTLVVLDLDAFKLINDALGHQAGDALLVDVAGRLRSRTRPSDVLGRIGGDELAVLLPETAGLQALEAIESFRAALRTVRAAGRPVTVSAGLCDLEHARDASDLFRLADGALYWVKAHGRDRACLYDPSVVRELSAEERAEQLARTQALVGLRGLARAIDAKDPSTRRHSDRVADLAARLAAELGWDRDRVALLRETALLHDVGKIGVPDAILRKPGRLTPEEYREVKRHAALGADIVCELLAPEQVAWVRHHHERPDGSGYPDGLAGEAIPDGARVIAVADAFDVMTAARPYSWPKPVAEAVSEVCHLAGSQFDPMVCSALVALHARDGLGR